MHESEAGGMSQMAVCIRYTPADDIFISIIPPQPFWLERMTDSALDSRAIAIARPLCEKSIQVECSSHAVVCSTVNNNSAPLSAPHLLLS